MAAVASPAYFEQHPAPRTPGDLTRHRCINIRFPTQGGLYVWEFERRGREQNVRVDGQVVFNTPHHIVQAALEGLDVAFLPERRNSRRTSTRAGWCACSRTGARRSPAITSTTPAGGNPRRHFG